MYFLFEDMGPRRSREIRSEQVSGTESIAPGMPQIMPQYVSENLSGLYVRKTMLHNASPSSSSSLAGGITKKKSKTVRKRRSEGERRHKTIGPAEGARGHDGDRVQLEGAGEERGLEQLPDRHVRERRQQESPEHLVPSIKERIGKMKFFSLFSPSF